MLWLLARDVAARIPAFTLQLPGVLLEWIRPPLGVVPAGGDSPAVVLIHGILRGRPSMNLLARDFRRSGCRVLNWKYPSTRAGIREHARSLAERLSRFLEPGESLVLVGHSMGGLVARALLDEAPEIPVRRIVQVGTPNRGALKAALLGDSFLYKWTLGTRAGRELVPGPGGLAERLPVPPAGLAHVVAGARGNGKGWSPLLPGDDDGTVELSSTALPGASQEEVKVLHAFLPWNRMVRRKVLEAALGRRGSDLDRASLPPDDGGIPLSPRKEQT